MVSFRREQRSSVGERLVDRRGDGRQGRRGPDHDRQPRSGRGLPHGGGCAPLPAGYDRQFPPPARAGASAALHDRFGGFVPRGPQSRRDGVGTGRPRGLREQDQRVDQRVGQPPAVGAHHRRMVPHHAVDVARCGRRRRGRHHERGQGQGAGVRQEQRTPRDVQGRGRPGGGQGRDHGDRRFPPQGRQIQGVGRQDSEGRPAGGPSGYGQDAAGQGRGRRGQPG